MRKLISKLTAPPLLFCLGSIVWVNAHWGLLSKRYIFAHDSFYWYGIFHYFAESLYNGFYPLWNPYLHAGEAFFENFSQLSLIDPINIAGIFLGKLFGIRDLFYLYEIIVLAKIIALAAGTQLFFNEIVPPIKKYSYLIFFVLLLSSFSINCYHQNGAFLVFGYSPFILLFFIYFSRRPSWLNALLLAYFFGVSFQSVVFAYVVTFMALFIVFFLLFNKRFIRVIFENKLKVVVMLAIFICLSSPAWSLLFYKSGIFAYGRFLFNAEQNASIMFSDYSVFKTSLAAFGKWGDIISLGSFYGATELYTGRYHLSRIPISELNMFVGLVPFLLGIIGLFFGRHKYKPVFIMLLFAIGCLFIGPLENNYVYKVLFYIFPPLKTIENSHEFANYFLFSFVFFICIGISTCMEWLRNSSFDKYRKAVIITLFVASLLELNNYVQHTYDTDDRLGKLFTLKKRSMISSNFERNSLYEIKQRQKTVLPYLKDKNNILITAGGNKYYGLVPISDARLKGVYSLSVSDPNYLLNFQALIQRDPAAIDFYRNFPYCYLRMLFPTALTYPKPYADILKSDLSQDLKAALLGVDLPVFEFYTRYEVIPAKEVLENKNVEKLRNILSKSVILSDMNIPMPVQATESVNSRIEILAYRPGYVKLRVDNDYNGILLFRDGFHRDWTAKANSIAKKLYRANYNQKAIFIEKGKNTIEFVFRPLAYIISLYAYSLISVAIFIICLCSFLKSLVSRRGEIH